MENKKDCGCKNKQKNSNKTIFENDIKMSVPEGKEFNKWYSTTSADTSIEEINEHLVDQYNRNRPVKDHINKAKDISNENNKIPKDFGWHLNVVVSRITKLLKEKNAAYGNSALTPLNVFSKLDAVESLCARLDDKLARIRNRGINDATEDTVDDLIGYLLLLKMAQERKRDE
tara:strand:+ start:64 stop:582 length:519 start_codon:yes stop_codon:yes gene_type:complete